MKFAANQSAVSASRSWQGHGLCKACVHACIRLVHGISSLFHRRLTLGRALTALVLAGHISPVFAYADRGAHKMPYTRYESEASVYGGGSILRSATDFAQENTASEASSQRYVSLPTTGSYLEWRVTTPGDGVTLRFTLPDSANGTGLSGNLDVYINGKYDQTINLSSYHAWQYFAAGQSHPTNTPGGRAAMRFDELRFRLGSKLNPGDTLRLQKNNTDTLDYGIDFIELEQIPAPRARPNGYVSIIDFGARVDDDIDDLPAWNAALLAAQQSNTGVYMPPGKYVFSDRLNLVASSVGVQGAGMWYTELFFNHAARAVGGINILGSDILISHIYLNTVNNQRSGGGGIRGGLGENSRIDSVWVQHFETGAWFGVYGSISQDRFDRAVTRNLLISNSRFRNNYADGVNFAEGTSYSVVEHSNIRNNGDDGLAVWPSRARSTAPEGVENIFRYSTIEHNWRAASVGIFGGRGHQAHNLLIRDCFASPGLRATDVFAGHPFNSSGRIRFSNITIQRCGTSADKYDSPRGAVNLSSPNGGVRNVRFENIDIKDSQRHAVQLEGRALENISFDTVFVRGVGRDWAVRNTTAQPDIKSYGGVGIIAKVPSGSTNFTRVFMSRIEDQNVLNIDQRFALTVDIEPRSSICRR